MRDDEAALLRQFEATVSGAELADLRALVGRFLAAGDVFDERRAPELRRPRRERTVVYRVRVDLEHARPPIWRRLDLRSDLTLGDVHEVLQVAYGWYGAHLFRFALGGSPFDDDAQWFLCPYDLQEEGGVGADEVRLDETLHEPGDVLRYVYDYGDDWRLTIRLEQVLPATADAPAAMVVAGRRAGPPEDCGGLTDGDDLAAFGDPALFDLDVLNALLVRAPSSQAGSLGLPPRLEQIREQLVGSDVGEDVSSVVLGLAFEPSLPADEELARALHPHLWFLDWAADEGGIPLTGAGYLRPVDLAAASRVVPAMAGRVRPAQRESQAEPLLAFRRSLRTLGLLRKNHERLLLTKAGAAARQDPRLLHDKLVAALAPPDEGYEADATLLLLAYAATPMGSDDPDPSATVSRALTRLGWKHAGGLPVRAAELTWLPAYGLLANLQESGPRPSWPFGPVAGLLAHAALRRAAG